MRHYASFLDVSFAVVVVFKTQSGEIKSWREWRENLHECPLEEQDKREWTCSSTPPPAKQDSIS